MRDYCYRVYNLGGGGYGGVLLGCLVLDEGQRTEHEVPTIVREVIEDYVHRHSPVAWPAGGRWVPVPRSQTGG